MNEFDDLKLGTRYNYMGTVYEIEGISTNNGYFPPSVVLRKVDSLTEKLYIQDATGLLQYKIAE